MKRTKQGLCQSRHLIFIGNKKAAPDGAAFEMLQQEQSGSAQFCGVLAEVVGG